MKLALTFVLVVAAGCDDGGSSQPPDAPKLVDAAPPDAAPDAPPDALDTAKLTMACMKACDAVGACLMEPVGPDCYSECAVDLGDCTSQELTAIEACTTEPCGDPQDPESSPMMTCLIAVGCVDG